MRRRTIRYTPGHVALLNRRQAGTGANARVHAGGWQEVAPLSRVASGRAIVAGRRIALHAVRDGIHGVFQRVEQGVDGVVHPLRDGAPLLFQPILVALKPCDEDSEQRPSGLACISYTCARRSRISSARSGRCIRSLSNRPTSTPIARRTRNSSL